MESMQGTLITILKLLVMADHTHTWWQKHLAFNFRIALWSLWSHQHFKPLILFQDAVLNGEAVKRCLVNEEGNGFCRGPFLYSLTNIFFCRSKNG